jgi:hypothetical protein
LDGFLETLFSNGKSFQRKPLTIGIEDPQTIKTSERGSDNSAKLLVQPSWQQPKNRVLIRKGWKELRSRP